ncbi:hypothetical protein HY061_02655 [Candidatus Azambacteria bacterium]|nr:hypothetical protein [Candidatus Azambacteria bacterium]
MDKVNQELLKEACDTVLAKVSFSLRRLKVNGNYFRPIFSDNRLEINQTRDDGVVLFSVVFKEYDPDNVKFFEAVEKEVDGGFSEEEIALLKVFSSVWSITRVEKSGQEDIVTSSARGKK